MASKVQIGNMALSQLGDEIIMSLDENSKPARLLTTFFDAMRKEVLADHTWTFARKRTSLARLAEAPTFEFAYAYQLPSDYIRMVRMGEEDEELTWKVEGKTLLTDEAEALVLYIKDVEDPEQFSPKFTTCLSLRLAAEIAPSLTGVNSGKKEAMLKFYQTMLSDAETVDSQESTPPRLSNNSTWNQARF